MIARWVLCITIYFCWNSHLIAKGVDEEYKKPLSKQIWGDVTNLIYGLPGFKRSYALVVGISDYENYLYLNTEQDPLRVKDYLVNDAEFDYVRLITGNEVTLQKIRSLMIDFFPQKLSSNDRFLFYWSGHGVTYTNNNRKFGYLPLSKSKHSQYSSMLSMRNLAEWDERLPAKQTLYLMDACYSGNVGITRMSDHKMTLEQIARPSRQVLTAGLDDEQTFASDKLGGSVFTTAVLDGLRGKADTGYDHAIKDGIISAGELAIYVKSRVNKERQLASWKKTITPTLKQLNHQEGDFFFFSTKQSGTLKQVTKKACDDLRGNLMHYLSQQDIASIGSKQPMTESDLEYQTQYQQHIWDSIDELEKEAKRTNCPIEDLAGYPYIQ